MIKKVLTAMLALCMVIALCGCQIKKECGTSNENNTAEDKNDGEEIIENDTNGKDATDAVEKDDGNKEDYKITITDTADELEEELEALEDKIISETESSVAELEAEYEKLVESITTYDEYVSGVKRVEAFYDKVNAKSEEIAGSLYKYTVIYAETVLNANISADDMYDAMDGIYDCIYEDAGDVLYDGIYDGILDDIYDDFYDGVLEDRDENVSYGDWSSVRSDEYKMLSDTRSDCYEHKSDMCSDIYDFRSDVKGKLYKDDIEGARKELKKFKEDVEEDFGAISGGLISNTAQDTNTNQETTKKEDVSTSGLDPEFKAAMDSYEAFINEYVEFMKKYKANPTDLGLLSDYTEYMRKYTKFAEDFEKWDDEEMNVAEASYYIEVQSRVSKKLIEAAY